MFFNESLGVVDADYMVYSARVRLVAPVRALIFVDMLTAIEELAATTLPLESPRNPIASAPILDTE